MCPVDRPAGDAAGARIEGRQTPVVKRHAQRFKFHPGETSSFILISHVVVHHGRVPAHAVEMGGHIHGDAVGFQLRRGGLAADGSFRKRIGAGILKDELVSEGLARLNGGVG